MLTDAMTDTGQAPQMSSWWAPLRKKESFIYNWTSHRDAGAYQETQVTQHGEFVVSSTEYQTSGVQRGHTGGQLPERYDLN